MRKYIKITFSILTVLLILHIITTYVISISSKQNKSTNNAEEIWRFSYTEGVEEFVAPYTGKYYIEAYGASGGNASTVKGGTGGKTAGYYNLKQGEKIYICVGGEGTNSKGGYNGGGSPASGAYGGGGATSITKTNRGSLDHFEKYKEEVIAVAGGGGGAGTNMLTNSENMPIIGCGGGLTGGAIRQFRTTEELTPSWYKQATYLSGYAFGKGESGQNGGGSGGGGYYGGIGNRTERGGGLGGAGYVSKEMYDTISQESTKIGNGSVSIRYSGKVQSTITINLYGKATIDGKSDKITISKYAGEFIELNPTCQGGYRINAYVVKYGDAQVKENRIEVGFSNSNIDVVYDADLMLTSTTFDGTCTLSFKEDDSFNKKFQIYQSLDGKNWYFASLDTENISKKVETREYNYTGRIESFVAPYNTEYRLYLYGAQGGDSIAQGDSRSTSGRGGYTQGGKTLNKGETLYICVGGQGSRGNLGGLASGGYNGGGYGCNDSGGSGASDDNEASGGGGGATSITTQNRGVLSNFNAHRDEVVAVAGGGGGGSFNYSAGSGGGLSGGACGTGKVANQNSGYAFGQGQNGNGSADSDGVGGGRRTAGLEDMEKM